MATTDILYKPHRKNLFYSAVTANLLYVTIGSVTAWPSAALSILEKQGLTSTQETWMVSLSMLGSCLGPSLFTFAIDRLGRRYTLLTANLIYLASWTILALGEHSAYALCTARFIGGFANGFTIVTVPTYVTEISDVKMRQTMASLAGPSVSLGLLIQYGISPWLSYNLIILVSAVPSLIFTAAWIRLRESPYHLVAKGRKKEATDVLFWLRGTSGIEEELQQIEVLVAEMRNNSVNKMELFTRPSARKALLLSSFLLFIQPFSGVDVIGSYLDKILSETSLPIKHQTATVIIGGANTVFALGEPLVVHRFGSKWTMVVCSFFCALSLFSFGIFKYFDERNYNVSSVTFIPIVCVILFELFFGLGYGSLPWSISAELFTPALKGFANNLVTTMNCIMAFTATWLYGYLTPIIGISWYFIITTLFFMVGDIIVAFVLPNTASMSLEKIQRVLEGTDKTNSQKKIDT